MNKITAKNTLNPRASRIIFNVPTELGLKLREIANEESRTLSSLMLYIVNDFIERRGK